MEKDNFYDASAIKYIDLVPEMELADPAHLDVDEQEINGANSLMN